MPVTEPLRALAARCSRRVVIAATHAERAAR